MKFVKNNLKIERTDDLNTHNILRNKEKFKSTVIVILYGVICKRIFSKMI
jgi:hypothetical protein